MKTLPRKTAVVILTLALATSAFAGQIQCPGAASNHAGTSPETTETIMTEINTTDIAATVILMVTSLPPY